MSIRPSVSLILAVVVGLGASAVQARDLTFAERVRAQQAIERVYYSHQVGATRPFDEAVPGAVLEKKVRTYLGQSAALEKYWHTPVVFGAGVFFRTPSLVALEAP